MWPELDAEVRLSFDAPNLQWLIVCCFGGQTADRLRAIPHGLAASSLLKCGHCGTSMGISFVKKKDKLYRYYVCVRATKSGYDSCTVRSLPAATAEDTAMHECLPTEADFREALMNIEPGLRCSSKSSKASPCGDCGRAFRLSEGSRKRFLCVIDVKPDNAAAAVVLPSTSPVPR